MSNIDTSCKTHGAVTAATASTTGRRWDMEDAHQLLLGVQTAAMPSLHYAAVFDGHGGKRAALWAADNLHTFLAAMPNDSAASIQRAFLVADSKLREVQSAQNSDAGDFWASQDRSGTTVAAAVVTPGCQNGLWQVTTAHAGDSRVLLITPDTVISTSDHKPDDAEELARITAAGGTVSHVGCPRVDGTLAVSRALGDFSYKQNREKSAARQRVTAMPTVEMHQITARTRIVIACDGLFEQLSNEQIAAYVRKQSSAQSTALGLVELALRSGSSDNISAVVLWLDVEPECAITRPATPDPTASTPAGTPADATDVAATPIIERDPAAMAEWQRSAQIKLERMRAERDAAGPPRSISEQLALLSNGRNYHTPIMGNDPSGGTHLPDMLVIRVTPISNTPDQ